MTINIEYETDKKLDLDYEKIINEVVNEAAAYEKYPEIELAVIPGMSFDMKGNRLGRG